MFHFPCKFIRSIKIESKCLWMHRFAVQQGALHRVVAQCGVRCSATGCACFPMRLMCARARTHVLHTRWTRAHACTLVYVLRARAYERACSCTRLCTCLFAPARSHVHGHARAHMCARAHTRAHTRAHVCTHVHKHARISTLALSLMRACACTHAKRASTCTLHTHTRAIDRLEHSKLHSQY